MTDAKVDNHENDQKSNQEGGQFRLDSKLEAYLQELLKEKHILSTAAYPHASRLMQEEIQRTQQSGKIVKDTRYADVYRERPIRVTVKVAVPIREHPKFNFVGKLLGPKGNSLKRLQEETMCKMSILGRGSMKDKVKEEELRKGLDPKFSHLSDDLHIEISALAPPAEAHARMAYALAEIRKFLIPDSNDDISLEQLREMENYLEPGVPGTEEEPPHKRPLVRPVRGAFRGRHSNSRGGISSCHGRVQLSNRFSTQADKHYYSNAHFREREGEKVKPSNQYYRADVAYHSTNVNLWPWKNLMVPTFPLTSMPRVPSGVLGLEVLGILIPHLERNDNAEAGRVKSEEGIKKINDTGRSFTGGIYSFETVP